MKRYRTVTFRVDQRERLRRHIRNCILANAAIVNRSLFNDTEESKSKRIAEMVADDLLMDYRLVRRD